MPHINHFVAAKVLVDLCIERVAVCQGPHCFSKFHCKLGYTSLSLQIDPDPEFRTVAFPNPEEGHSALVSILIIVLTGELES